MLEFKYDTQLLIDGDDLDEDEVYDYFVEHFKGDCLLAVGGDGDPIKIHYHTNEPWKVLEYCSTIGEIYDIVVEDMDRQSRGLKGCNDNKGTVLLNRPLITYSGAPSAFTPASASAVKAVSSISLT